MSSRHHKLTIVSLHGRVMRIWVRLLLLSLLGQLLLPLQAHTQWQIDDRGRLVEMCTLQGLQSVRVDPSSGDALPAAPDHDPDFSPAVAFSALLAHAAVASFAVLPRQHVRCELPATQRAVRTPLPPDLSDVTIRGPPARLA